MSRKHRTRKPTTARPATPIKEKPSARLQADALNALDGYSNPAGFLGQDSPLVAAGTFIRSNLTSDVNLLTTAYREYWLAMRIIDMPAEDMTRAWITLNGKMGEEDLEDLRNIEARHGVKQELANAIRWARLYGGSLAFMVIRGEGGRLDQPLNVQGLAPDCFQGLLVLDRTQGVTPSIETEEDLDDPDFGLPKYYTVDMDTEEGSVKIHHSRFLRFVGRELPKLETIRENYWGASELEHIWDELLKRSSTSANISQLVYQANITTLKMAGFGEDLAMGTEHTKKQILDMLAAENRVRTSFGLQVLSKDDAMENHAYSFAGLSEVYEAFMMDIAGAAEIPATKLFGRSPQGFQSTGESDMKNYYEMISGLQEKMLRPALERLLPVMAVSCWGFVPEDLGFVFNPLGTQTPQERAALLKELADPVVEMFKAGMVSCESAVREVKALGEPYGAFANLEPVQAPGQVLALPVNPEGDKADGLPLTRKGTAGYT